LRCLHFAAQSHNYDSENRRSCFCGLQGYRSVFLRVLSSTIFPLSPGKYLRPMFLVKDELLYERHVADLCVDGLNSLDVDLLLALFRAETASHFGFSWIFS
jgi:hypothetical protein